MDYDTVFAKVIAKQWNALAVEEQQLASTKPNRKGKLAPDHPASCALWDSYNYQKGHIDVFEEVYKQANHYPPKKYERLMVVDIGAAPQPWPLHCTKPSVAPNANASTTWPSTRTQ